MCERPRGRLSDLRRLGPLQKLERWKSHPRAASIGQLLYQGSLVKDEGGAEQSASCLSAIAEREKKNRKKGNKKGKSVASEHQFSHPAYCSVMCSVISVFILLLVFCFSLHPEVSGVFIGPDDDCND